MALAEELGYARWPYAAASPGELHGTLGRLEEAHAHLATAIEAFRSMAMTPWLARAEAARASLACGSSG